MVNHPNRSQRSTPGPWSVVDFWNRSDIHAGNRKIAGDITNAHDASLIVAAPELYDALIEAATALSTDEYGDLIGRCAAALAKARGEG